MLTACAAQLQGFLVERQYLRKPLLYSRALWSLTRVYVLAHRPMSIAPR